MLSVTSTWKNYLLSEDYELYILLSNQTLINMEIPNSHILQDSFSMNRFSVTGSTIEIGAATAAEVQFTVDNSDGTFDDVVFEGAEIHIKLRHFENKGTEQETSFSINIGVAYVDEVVRHQDSIQIVCLDKMVQLDKPVSGMTYTGRSVLSLLSASGQSVKSICSECGLNYNSSASSLVNANVTIAAPTSENLTYRALLQWVCQITGTCAYIDSNGSLVLNWYDMDNAQDDLTVSNRFSSEIDREAITVTGVSVTVGDTQYTSSNDASYMIAVEGNELISDDNVSTIVSGLAARINGFTYYPFSAQTMNLCWLQPLDTANYIDKNDVDHPIIITDWTFSPGRNLSLSGKGESATRKGYASNPPFTAAQQRIIEEIKKNAPDVQIDDKIAAVFALNEAVNNGMMLYEATVNGNKYYFNEKPEDETSAAVLAALAGSTYIATFNDSGFAWTKGDGCWNNGNPTYEYGINMDEDSAIFKAVTATKINADLLTAGEINANLVHIINLIAEDLEIKNGNTVVHKFNSEDYSAIIGGGYENGGISYDPVNGTRIGSGVKIGGSATIGEAITDAVDDAVEALDIVGIDSTEIKYVASSSGTTVPGESASWQTTVPTVSQGQYLWTRTKTTYTDGNYDYSYSVARQGSNGTSVTISSIKYAKNQDQSTQPSDSSFDTAVPTLNPGDWLWTKTTYSNGSTAITKTYIGADGRPGNDGKGIYNTAVKYGIGTSATDSSTVSNWQDTPPALSGNEGKYLWTRTQIYYTTSPSTVGSTSYSVSYIAANGSTGAAGRGISSITQYFYPSSSDDISNIPAVGNTAWKTSPSDFTGTNAFSETNRYLWTYTKTVYANPTSTVYGNRYILGVWGAKGSSGSGTQGRGISSITPQYALSTSNSTAPTSGWSEIPPEYPSSAFTYTKSASRSVSSGYSSVSLITGVSIANGNTYTIKYQFSPAFSSSCTLRIYNDSGTVKQSYTIAANTESGEISYTANFNADNAEIGLEMNGSAFSYTAQIEGEPQRYYYWQRDKIVWTDGSDDTYTTAVLSQGFNAAIYSANRLNTSFAEVELAGVKQVYMDAGHIYANSLTAYNIAAYEAFIKNLMANYVRVDGNIDVVNGDISIASEDYPTQAVQPYLDRASQAEFGVPYASLQYNWQRNTAQLYAKNMQAVDRSKFVVSNDSYITFLMPEGMRAYSGLGANEFSHYGKNLRLNGYAAIGGKEYVGQWGYAALFFNNANYSDYSLGVEGDLVVSGDLYVDGTIHGSGGSGGSSPSFETGSVYIDIENHSSDNGGYYYGDKAITFSKTYTNTPTVFVQTNAAGYFASVESCSTTGATIRSWGLNSGVMSVTPTTYWVAFSND